MFDHRGSVAGTHSTLASRPASSSMKKTATGRARMWQPGNVASSRRIMASSGSPSSPRVPGMKP